MRKELLYIVSVALLFVSCEKYYTPKLDKVDSILVIESHLTNDAQQNFVKVTATNGYYDTNTTEPSDGVSVDLIDMQGKTMNALDFGNGYFRFTDTPVPGREYKLVIRHYMDKYESEVVKMPSLPSIDTAYTEYQVQKTYRTNTIGPPVPIETPVREMYIDAPITQSLQYYRFAWRAVLQWTITPPSTPFGSPPSTNGWLSLYDKDQGLINLAGPKLYSSASQIKKHPILSIPYEYGVYLDSKEKNKQGWILIIDEFGITRESYDFHNELNKQLTAEGNLFDPVLAQVYGNIHCTTNASKVVLGYFDLSSYRQYRYYFNVWAVDEGKVILRQLDKYPYIPDNGQTVGDPPYFWEFP